MGGWCACILSLDLGRGDLTTDGRGIEVGIVDEGSPDAGVLAEMLPDGEEAKIDIVCEHCKKKKVVRTQLQIGTRMMLTHKPGEETKGSHGAGLVAGS